MFPLWRECAVLCYFPIYTFSGRVYVQPPHKITERTVVMGLSMFAISAAFSSKYRGILLLNFLIAVCAAIAFGSYAADEVARIDDMPSIFLYFVAIFAILEWSWRHFHDDEDCPVYKTFKK